MQRKILSRLSTISLACAAIVAACGGDTGLQSPVTPTAAKNGTAGPAGDSTGTTPPATSPTSSGPVVAIRVTPQSATLPIGHYLTIGAVGLDAEGRVVVGKRATVRSADEAIVAVASDTGTIVGKALGTAKVYSTIDGFTDSTTITVIATPVSQGPTAPPATSQPGVSSFDLVATIVGSVPGSDTTRTTPVAGATLKLTRVGSVNGDTLATSVDAGSATTDASGGVSIRGLAGGAYVVDITPPAGSPYQRITTGFAPPHDSEIRMTFRLSSKP